MDKLNSALAFLRGKYGAAAGSIVGDRVELPDGTQIKLLPHRVERRFVELKNMIDNRTLEGVSTLRFAHFESGGSLSEILWREFDLAVWLTGCGIRSLYAVCSGNVTANVIARLRNDLSLSLEAGVGLPDGEPPKDRHEIIAARGVGCDGAVDRQVPGESIYVYGEKNAVFTDVDEELFGLSTPEILRVRAAFAVLSEPALGEVWNAALATAQRAADAVFAADARLRVVKL